MADEGGTASRPRPPAMTRVPWYVIGAMIFVGVLGGVLIPKSSNKKTDQGARGVVVATDAPRTVVVPPCTPPVVVTPANAETIRSSVQGTTAVTLPRAPGTRVVVVPRCVPGAPGSPSLPSAAFVLRQGKQTTTSTSSKGGDPIAQGVLRQVLVPPGSPARTVIVPRCRTKSKAKAGSAVQLPPPPHGSTVVVAPPC
jgi:hypothetical protein